MRLVPDGDVGCRLRAVEDKTKLRQELRPEVPTANVADDGSFVFSPESFFYNCSVEEQR
jgi:hypothetical protein